MKTQYQLVKEFHQAFQNPVADAPVMLSSERVAKRAGWLLEEIEEFKDAATLEDQVDAMIDTLYFAYGTLVELGVDPDPIFEIVHRANMAKLFPDGLPHFHNGKVIKPDNWQAPEPKIREEIERQKSWHTK